MAGLVASVITKWRSNDKYSYGYVRAEILAGFINGLFLLFISFFIFSEAVERLVEPPEVKHERLLPVSIAGRNNVCNSSEANVILIVRHDFKPF